MSLFNKSTALRKKGPNEIEGQKKIKNFLTATAAGYAIFLVIFIVIWTKITDDSKIDNKNNLKSSQVLSSTESWSKEQLIKEDSADFQGSQSERIEDQEEPAKMDAGLKLDQKEVFQLVPKGKPPNSVKLAGEIKTASCWDAAGFSLEGKSCGALGGIETVIKDRLYVIDRCKQLKASSNAVGNLDLGMEVDFASKTVSFWARPTSRFASAVEIANCLRTELAGLPFHDLNPKFARYQVDLTVEFKVAEMAQAMDNSSSPSQLSDLDLIENGKIVSVVKDRVRVRKAPIDGEIIGKIGSGNRVLLLEESDGWCKVKTMRGNIGWMACWSLGI